MTSAKDFRGGYSPGGEGPKTRRRRLARENGRKGGLAAGVTRRQLARGRRVPHRRTRDQALALAYHHQHVSRVRFDELYGKVFPCPERGTAASAWETGRDTLWLHYHATYRLYAAAGQHARTTNGQRGSALSSLGRPRCRRTLQRLNRKLEALGLAVVSHYKDQRDRPGHKDCLVVEVRTPILHVTPPLRGSPHRDFVPEVGAAAPEKNQNSATGTASAPPATPADDRRPDKPAYDQHRDREAERELTRGSAPTQSLFDLYVAARRSGAPVEAVPRGLPDCGDHNRRRRGELGLREVQGSVPAPDGRPAAQPQRPEHAGGLLRGDAVGGGVHDRQLEILRRVSLDAALRPPPATPESERARPPERG